MHLKIADPARFLAPIFIAFLVLLTGCMSQNAQVNSSGEMLSADAPTGYELVSEADLNSSIMAGHEQVVLTLGMQSWANSRGLICSQFEFQPGQMPKLRRVTGWLQQKTCSQVTCESKSGVSRSRL